MFFSTHNKNITYDNERGYGTLAVEGTGKVCQEDTDVMPMMCSKEEWIQHWTKIIITNGITEIGPGFLETFAFMTELTIHYSVKTIAVTPELKSLLVSRQVVIRGWRNSEGERLAQELGLKFIQADILVGWFVDYDVHERTKLVIMFDKGRPYLFYDVFTSCGGGCQEVDLDENFYVGATLESFAERKEFSNFRDEILKNKDLEYYFNAANGRC